MLMKKSDFVVLQTLVVHHQTINVLPDLAFFIFFVNLD